jgi:hypothetical protein
MFVIRHALIAAIFMLSDLNAQTCGKERWDVKILADTAVYRVDFDHPIRSSVRKQTELTWIKPKHNQPRMNRVEMKTYTLRAYLIGFVLEDDKDYHLVMKDTRTDSTMVAEVPDPSCPEVAATEYAAKYAAVRDWIDQHAGKPTGSFKTLKKPLLVKFSGVGFYDKLHGQHGMAKNGREIHPVLEIRN